MTSQHSRRSCDATQCTRRLLGVPSWLLDHATFVFQICKSPVQRQHGLIYLLDRSRARFILHCHLFVHFPKPRIPHRIFPSSRRLCRALVPAIRPPLGAGALQASWLRTPLHPEPHPRILAAPCYWQTSFTKAYFGRRCLYRVLGCCLLLDSICWRQGLVAAQSSSGQLVKRGCTR
jgi:hypothetical protein